MNLLFFIIILIISVVVVKIGCIAFELTRVNGTQAVFQAISCFTGTGFLLSSGYSLEGEAEERLKRGCDAVIQKPFKLERY